MDSFLIPPGQTLIEFCRVVTDEWELGVGTRTLPSIQIAPEGMSGNRCRKGHFLPFVPPGATTNLCGDCGGIPTEKLGVLLRDVPLLERPSEVLSRTWWHSSDNPSFHSDPDATPIHLGSMEAAEQRAIAQGYHFLYEVQLRPEAQVSPNIYIESEHYDPGHATMVATAARGEIVRYVNNSEDAGGISILTIKSNFQPTPREHHFLKL